MRCGGGRAAENSHYSPFDKLRTGPSTSLRYAQGERYWGERSPAVRAERSPLGGVEAGTALGIHISIRKL
jgi:hypothetical protein